MKTNGKTNFSFVLLMMVTLGILLISCGEKNQSSSENESLIGSAEAEIFNETGLPIVKEPITIKVFAWKRAISGPWDEMPIWKEISAKTGINFEWIEVPQGSWKQKKNLAFASGDIADLMFGQMDKNSDINVYGPEGLLLKLDDYVDAFMPNLQKIYEERPYVRKLNAAIDGNLYSFPSFNELEQRLTPDNWFINKKWLDKLGLDVPKTTEEFYEALKAFRTQDPNGNGKNDEIPLTALGLSMKDIYGLNSLFGSFGWPLELTGLEADDEGQVIYVPQTEGYKEGIKFISKLYKDGLLDLETFTQDKSIYFSKGKETPEILGSFIFWHDDTMLGLERAEADYVTLPPLTGPSGQKPKWRNNLRSQFKVTNTVMATNNPYPASTARLIDYFYTEEMSWQIAYGPFGLTIKKNDDGTITPIDPPEGMNVGEFRFKNAPGGDTIPIAITKKMWKIFPGTLSIQRKAKRHEIYKPFLTQEKNYIPKGLNFSLEDKNEASSLEIDLKDYTEQKSVEWITGSSDIDKDWDDYLEQLNRIGLTRYLEIKQESFDQLNQE